MTTVEGYPGPTLDEWMGYIRAQRERSNGKVAPDNFHLAAQAAVLAENLTGDEHWDYFLQCLQGALEASQSDETMLLERLASEHSVDHDTIMRLKLALMDARATIRTLKWTIALPHEIKETGKVAQELDFVSPEIPV